MLEFNSVVYTWFRICISHSLSCLWCLNSSIFAWDFMGGWAHQCNKGFLLLLRGPQSVLSLEIDQWIEVFPAFSFLTLAVCINLIVQLSAVLAFGQWLVLWVLKSVAAVAPVIHFPLQRTATLCKWLWFASGMSRFVYWGCLRWTVDSWNRISTTYTTLLLIIETFESSDFARFWAAMWI